MTPTAFKEARQSLGLTQQGLADALGVSKRTVAGIENSADVPRIYALAVQALLTAAASSADDPSATA